MQYETKGGNGAGRLQKAQNRYRYSAFRNK